MDDQIFTDQEVIQMGDKNPKKAPKKKSTAQNSTASTAAPSTKKK